MSPYYPQQRYFGYYNPQQTQSYTYQKPDKKIYYIFAALFLIGGIIIILGLMPSKVDPDLTKIAKSKPNEVVRAVIFCNGDCNIEVIEAMRGEILGELTKENAVVVAIRAGKLLKLKDEKWVKRIAKPL